jgi:RNA polymerase sigma-70 factor (ECF subfamily)
MTRAPSPKPKLATAPSDTELVDRARCGDEYAFRTIMTCHNQRLYRVARAVLKDEADVEDVVQEAYLRAFAALSSYRQEASLATWLTRITINEALGRKRKQRATVGLDQLDAPRPAGARIIPFPNMSTETDPESSAAQAEIRRLLERAVDALPAQFRVVFVMRDVEEMSTEETAAALGLRPETVRTRLHRARRLLRQALEDQLASTLKGAFPFAGARCARITEAVLTRLGFASSGQD